MRVLLFYDLPTSLDIERKIARDFRNEIIKEGFLMLQESVYCKLVLNTTVLDGLKNRLKKLVPKNGNIMMLIVTEKQFSNMEILIGSKESKTIDKEDRLIII